MAAFGVVFGGRQISGCRLWPAWGVRRNDRFCNDLMAAAEPAGYRALTFAEYLSQSLCCERQLCEDCWVKATAAQVAAIEALPCPMCQVPAGSVCRTRAERVAGKYHTARFALVSSLREELAVLVPADRGPGRAWARGEQPARDWSPSGSGEPIRVGYARCSAASQDLSSQLDALQQAGCARVFSEKVSTRVRVRPELEAALGLAREIKRAAPRQDVIVTVHELKRLARSAAELMALVASLQADGIQLELLTGPLTGVYDPTGMGSMLFAVLAVAAQLDREYIRERTLEGQAAAAARGRHGGRPPVIDSDMALFARALREAGTAIPQIALKLVIKTGKNAGTHPSVASVYRALGELTEAGEDLDLTTVGVSAEAASG